MSQYHIYQTNAEYSFRGWQDTKSKFVERFLELSLFYGLSSPLNSEMICIFPYF